MPNYQQNLKQIIRRGGGEVFWRKITVLSSDLKSATALPITAAATGDLAITQVIVKTDSTGLAGGTNFQIASSNLKGSANIFVETVANLGANVTKVMAPATTDTDETTAPGTPTVTGKMTVLEAGQHLFVQNTASNGTGAGTADIYIKFERIVDNADVYMVGQQV